MQQVRSKPPASGYCLWLDTLPPSTTLLSCQIGRILLKRLPPNKFLPGAEVQKSNLSRFFPFSFLFSLFSPTSGKIGVMRGGFRGSRAYPIDEKQPNRPIRCP